MRTSLAAVVALGWVSAASALETPQWPPPEGVASRMRELQLVIIDRESTLAQREAAREELSGLLKSPAGQQRGRTADEKPARPARASLDPYPVVVAPVNVAPAPPPASGVARIEITEPPRPAINPRTGVATTPPSGRFAIDPRTGAVLHEAGNGFVDPRTGQFVPR